jgi:hypothetical protein
LAVPQGISIGNSSKTYLILTGVKGIALWIALQIARNLSMVQITTFLLK